jgi:hypothetical protein
MAAYLAGLLVVQKAASWAPPKAGLSGFQKVARMADRLAVLKVVHSVDCWVKLWAVQ